MRRNGSLAGFSLVELLVVVLLAGVLASLAAPSLRDAVHRARLRASLQRLSTDVYRTRALAASSGRPLHLRFDSAPGECARGYAVADAEVNQTLFAVDLIEEAPGVCLRVSGSPVLRVNSRGMLTGAARKVRVRLGESGDSLSISMVGRVYQWGYSAAGGSLPWTGKEYPVRQ